MKRHIRKTNKSLVYSIQLNYTIFFFVQLYKKKSPILYSDLLFFSFACSLPSIMLGLLAKLYHIFYYTTLFHYYFALCIAVTYCNTLYNHRIALLHSLMWKCNSSDWKSVQNFHQPYLFLDVTLVSEDATCCHEWRWTSPIIPVPWILPGAGQHGANHFLLSQA